MALARFQSGSGGLSINTTAANTPFGASGQAPTTANMFGSTQAKPSTKLFGLNSAPSTAATGTGGLFGTAQPSQTTGTGLFSQPAASQPAQTGSVFGAATSTPAPSGIFGSTSTASQPQSTGLFGAATTSQPTQSTGLFGSTSTSQPVQSSGMFGSALAQQQTSGGGGLFGSATPAASSLFGSTPMTSQPAAASNIFGQMASTSTQNQAGGLFGAKPAQNSLFGQTQIQQPQQQLQQQTSLYGGGISQPLGTLGRSTQGQVVPGVRIDASQIKGTTRFNDLHEDIQKQMEEIDGFIHGQIGFHRQCEAIMPKHHEDLTCVPPGVDLLSRQLIALDDALALDAQQASQARTTVQEDAERAKLSFKVVENLKLPPQFHTPGLWSGAATGTAGRSGSDGASNLVEYFADTADEIDKTLQRFQRNFSEVEQHLRTIEVTSAQQVNLAMARRDGDAVNGEDPVRELGLALVEFEESLLGVASKVGRARQGVQKLQLNDFPSHMEDRHLQNKRSGIY